MKLYVPINKSFIWASSLNFAVQFNAAEVVLV